MTGNIQGKGNLAPSQASPSSPGGAALSNSASDAVKLKSAVEAIGAAATARGFLTAQLEAFVNSEAPVPQNLPTLTASIRVETAKIRGLVRGNARDATTLTKELTVLEGLDPKTKRQLTQDHADLLYPNGQLDALLDAYFQDNDDASKLAWMHAATATILEAASPPPLNVAPAAVNLVADAVKALREFDRAFQALRLSVPDADSANGDRYSAFEAARRGAVGVGAVDFTDVLNQAVTSLISKCKADGEGIRALISITNDPNVPGSAVDSHGNIKFSAIQKLKSLIPALSAENVLRLYQELDRATGPLNQDYIRGALADQLTVLGTAAVAGAAGNLAGVRRAYGEHFAILGLEKPDLGDDEAILRQVTAELVDPDLTMASIMTYYAEATHDLGGLPREALQAIEAKLDTLAAPEPLEVDTFVQFVNHLRDFHGELTDDDDAAAKVKMTALLDRIIPFLPADMELADIALIHGDIGHENDKALLSEVLAVAVRDLFSDADVDIAGFRDLVAAHEAVLRPLNAADGALPIANKLEGIVATMAMDTPAALLAAHGVLGNLGEDAEVKAVFTSRLSELAGEDPSDDADAYIAFVTGFHAAYTALSPNGFAVIGAAKLPDNLSLEAVRRINTGLAEHAPNALEVVQPILIRRVLVSLDARATLPDIVQTYVPVLGALGLDRGEALTHLTGNGILHSRLSDNPAGLAAQFRGLGDDQAEDDQAALRDLFLSVLMQQAAAAPPQGADNDALQARIQSFLDASLTISGDAWDPTRDPVLIAVMRPIAESLAPQACVDLYTYLVRRDAGLVRENNQRGGAIPDALFGPLAYRVWVQVIDGTAAGFADSVNTLRGQLTALNYGANLAQAMLDKKIATRLPVGLQRDEIVALYTELTSGADKAAVRAPLLAQLKTAHEGLFEQVTADNFVDFVNTYREGVTVLEGVADAVVAALDIATRLPADLTTEDIKAIYTRLTEAADKAAVRDALANQCVKLYADLPQAGDVRIFIEGVNQLAADLGVLQIANIPAAAAGIKFVDRFPALSVAMTLADVDGIRTALAPLGVDQNTPGVYPRLIKNIESYLGRGRADVHASLVSLQALGQPEAAAKAIIISKLPFAECLNASDLVSTPALQDSLLDTAKSFLSNPANLDEEALLDLLPRMGELLGGKVAEIVFPVSNLAIKGEDAQMSSTLTAVQIRVLDTLASMKYTTQQLQEFRNQQLNEFKRVSLTLSKPNIVRSSGHTVLDYQRALHGNAVQPVFVQGEHNYDPNAVNAFLQMASGLAHIEDTEVQIGLLAELKHLVTKMTKGEARRTLDTAQLTTLMSIMETSAEAILAAPPERAPAATIRSDFLETMRLLGSEKTLNAVPKKDRRQELRSRHSAIMAMALAQGGAGEAAASSDSESLNSSKGFLPLSSISPADTTRLVAIYRGKFSGAGPASEKFGHIVSLANMLKEAVGSDGTNEKRTVVMDLLMATIDAASKANDFNTALQLVPFLRPLMPLMVPHNGNEVSIADVYGTRIATLLRSCASQPNAALKAEVVKAATDLALLTNDYPSKSWEQARRVLTLGLAGPLKLSGSASAGTTCGELSVMLLAKLAKDKSLVVAEAAKDGLFQLYSSRVATMDGAESDKMRHMVKIGMKDAGLGDSASSFMPNGAIRVGTDSNLAILKALDGVRQKILPETEDANLALEFVGQLRTLNPSSDLRPRAVAMMLDEVTKRVMTGGNGADQDVFALLGFVGGIASGTYGPRERLMALQTLRVLYPLMNKDQGAIKDIFKEITKGKVPTTGVAEFEQLRSQATAALDWIGERVAGSELGSSSKDTDTIDILALHRSIANDDEGGETLQKIIDAVNPQLNSRKELDVASIRKHLDLLAFWMSRYPELATTKPVSDFLLKLSNSRDSLVRFKVVPLLGQFAALCTDSGEVVVKRLQALATTGEDTLVNDAAKATFLKLLAGPAEANDAMRSVLKKHFPDDKKARDEATLAGISAVVHAFRTDVASTLQDMSVTQKLVAIDEVVLSYHKYHSQEEAVVTALGKFLPTSTLAADGASLAAARALMTLYPFLSNQKRALCVRLQTSMGTDQEVKAFLESKGVDRVGFIAAAEPALQLGSVVGSGQSSSLYDSRSDGEARSSSGMHSSVARASSSSLHRRPAHHATYELIQLLEVGLLDTRKAALAALLGRFNEASPSEESLAIFEAVKAVSQPASLSTSPLTGGGLLSRSTKKDPFKDALAELEARILAAIGKGSVDLAEQYIHGGYSDPVRVAAARRLVGLLGRADSAAGVGGGESAPEAASDAESSPKDAIMKILTRYQSDKIFSELFKSPNVQFPPASAKAKKNALQSLSGAASSRVSAGGGLSLVSSSAGGDDVIAATVSPVRSSEKPLGRGPEDAVSPNIGLRSLTRSQVSLSSPSARADLLPSRDGSPSGSGSDSDTEGEGGGL